MSIPFLACMIAVSQFYALPPRALPAIQAVEGGTVGFVRRNADGSEDLGPMQVNSRWIAPIAAATGDSPERVRGRLVDDGCFNVAAAGAILRIYLDEAGGALLPAIGNYHSHTPALHGAYRERVLAAARRLFTAKPPG